MSRMIFKPRTPAFMDVELDPPTEFETLKELKNIPHVKRWVDGNDFVRLSICRQEPHENYKTLMAEVKESFWVIGYICGDYILKLPEWKAPKSSLKNRPKLRKRRTK